MDLPLAGTRVFKEVRDGAHRDWMVIPESTPLGRMLIAKADEVIRTRPNDYGK